MPLLLIALVWGGPYLFDDPEEAAQDGLAGQEAVEVNHHVLQQDSAIHICSHLLSERVKHNPRTLVSGSKGIP